MSIIVGKNSKVVVQGMTGNEGRFHTASMLRYGTRIVAGVTPGKGGQQVQDIPVYNTVSEAVSNHGANTSIAFVPARFAQSAILESIDAGIQTLVVITELIPQKDAIEFIDRADKKGNVIIVGPNTPGVINPSSKTHVGIVPVHVFKPGVIGMVSRSGTLTYEIAWHLSNAGLGQSTCVGIGGDAIVGLDFIKVLKMFKDDEETKGVVLIGEVGGNNEELAAEYISEAKYPKPVVGKTSPTGEAYGACRSDSYGKLRNRKI